MDTKSNDDSGGSDSLDKSMQRKCVMVETSATTTEPAAETDSCSRDSAALRESPPGEPKTDVSSAESTIGENSATHKTSTTSSSNTTAASAAFETKVKLISQNLKETTLAETEAVASTSNTSSDVADGQLIDDIVEQHSNTGSCEHRVKKVRFHPDVKANDGGNRVKKKIRSTRTSASKANLSCDGMDMDDDNEECDDDEVLDEEEEEEFNLAKTIAEADDYLKQHPLTFVRRVEQNGERLRDGLLNIEDMPQLIEREVKAEKNNEDDFYKKCKPENGIERILGKETKAGKVEYLLRYENQGLFWESEDYIRRMCPNLLKAYEKNRERRQQRLMHHVAKRQSLRQRYTDF